MKVDIFRALTWCSIAAAGYVLLGGAQQYASDTAWLNAEGGSTGTSYLWIAVLSYYTIKGAVMSSLMWAKAYIKASHHGPADQAQMEVGVGVCPGFGSCDSWCSTLLQCAQHICCTLSLPSTSRHSSGTSGTVDIMPCSDSI